MPSIWCALRTFAAHAREMGGEPLSSPRFFLKPWAALAQPPIGCEMMMPPHLNEVHHEVELVLRLGEDVTLTEIAVGLDLTDRITQDEAKAAGMPWTQSKGFANSAIVGNFVEPPVGLPHLRLELAVNGEPRQEASIGEMSFTPLDLLASLSQWAPLEKGDLLFCGTPSGIGPVARGDHIQARMLREDGSVLSELDLILV
ncbi:MAG: fumarylacetoacetate hydrolase family protein [Candidatus Thermoplasmatota archaeon]|nr:fumarylacetoacetate hydrolase family protein [Candidatus Thermoplasmatota archaeon]